jgi:hypothetical protein
MLPMARGYQVTSVVLGELTPMKLPQLVNLLLFYKF